MPKVRLIKSEWTFNNWWVNNGNIHIVMKDQVVLILKQPTPEGLTFDETKPLTMVLEIPCQL